LCAKLVGILGASAVFTRAPGVHELRAVRCAPLRAGRDWWPATAGRERRSVRRCGWAHGAVLTKTQTWSKACGRCELMMSSTLGLAV
jgi:hypothetical protein